MKNYINGKETERNENNAKTAINTIEPMNFCVATETTFISTNELAKKINYMFKNIFSDCQG